MYVLGLVSQWFLDPTFWRDDKPRMPRSKAFGFDESFSEESMGSSNDVCLSPLDGPVDW